MERQWNYILVGRTPVAVMDVSEWGRWMFGDGQTDHRRVAKTKLKNDVDVSTVFLGMDHGWSEDGPPILFETMVFGGPADGFQMRYATWDEAEAGHRKMVVYARRMAGELRLVKTANGDEEVDG